MLRSYTVGFALSVLLTAIPFALVASSMTPPRVTLTVIAVLGLAQILVHLRYFLHLDLKRSPREDLLALCFAAFLIVVMIGGSLWIMFDLHQRMLPG